MLKKIKSAIIDKLNSIYGSVVKRLRHRPFTAVTRVQFPSESLTVSIITVRIRRSQTFLFGFVLPGRLHSNLQKFGEAEC